MACSVPNATLWRTPVSSDHMAIEEYVLGHRLSAPAGTLFCSGLGPRCGTHIAHWSEFSTGCSATTLIIRMDSFNRLELLLRRGLINRNGVRFPQVKDNNALRNHMHLCGAAPQLFHFR